MAASNATTMSQYMKEVGKMKKREVVSERWRGSDMCEKRLW